MYIIDTQEKNDPNVPAASVGTSVTSHWMKLKTWWTSLEKIQGRARAPHTVRCYWILVCLLYIVTDPLLFSLWGHKDFKLPKQPGIPCDPLWEQCDNVLNSGFLTSLGVQCAGAFVLTVEKFQESSGRNTAWDTLIETDVLCGLKCIS